MAKYTVYKITNALNNKHYIGIHKTDNPNDSYMGSGNLIKKAISKYGKEHFSKQILHVYDTLQEASKKEHELINIGDPLTYNIKHGGLGGFDYINSARLNVHYGSRSAETKQKMKQNHWSKSEVCDLIKQKVSRSGSKASTKQKQKQSLAMKQKFLDNEYKKKFQKVVYVDGIKFDSQQDAANHFGLCKSTVSYRLKSNNFPNWNLDKVASNVKQ